MEESRPEMVVTKLTQEHGNQTNFPNVGLGTQMPNLLNRVKKKGVR